MARVSVTFEDDEDGGDGGVEIRWESDPPIPESDSELTDAQLMAAHAIQFAYEMSELDAGEEEVVEEGKPN